MTEPDYASSLAEALLQINAIRLSPQKPFTWASGLKSPVYCDNRLLLSYPALRQIAIDGLVQIARDCGPIDAIAGVATAGIPHGMLLADRLNLPFIYVRSKAKEHGKGNQIEGAFTPGQHVLVVEDLISTGGSSLQAAQALQEAGLVIQAVTALFTYGFPESEQRFAEASIPLRTISNYSKVLQVSQEIGQITAAEADVMSTWYQDPRAWSDRFLHQPV
ncbi:MAG: orotate phosphoribosyltransferase [Saprospiraceae bacterium]|nr:orotate phosphoribosyltransferase [Saprospiraceae bacterium]